MKQMREISEFIKKNTFKVPIFFNISRTIAITEEDDIPI